MARLRVQSSQQAADVPLDLLPRRCPGGTHRNRPAGGGLVDAYRRVAALTMEAAPEGELLAARRRIEGIVHVQSHGLRRGVVAGAVDVDHLAPQLDQAAEIA